MCAGFCCAKFERAMELEHCSKPVSSWSFTTSNYGVVTTPQAEWRLVLNADKGPDETTATFAKDGRRMPSFRNLMQLELSKKAGLTEAEVIAVILYTGPMVRGSSMFSNSLRSTYSIFEDV